MTKKLLEWGKRYLPAEALSLVATLVAGAATFTLSHNRAATALAATWAGNVAYFGCILLQDIVATRRARQAAGKTYTAKLFGKNLRALAVEFGAAEVLDSFLIRPLLMYYLPLWLGSLSGGILAAKLAADVTFYIPAIISYELSKKRLRDFQ